MSVTSFLAFRIMVGRWPQARVAARKPEISMFSLVVKSLGTWIGSVSINDKWLYKMTLRSRNDLMFSIVSMIVTD